MRQPRMLLVVGMSLCSAGCWSGKKAAPVVLVPPTPMPAVVPVKVAPDPPALPAPAIVTNSQPLPAPVPPAPPKQAAAAPLKRKKAPKAAPAVASSPVQPQPAPTEQMPQLQEILPADRRKQYEVEYLQGTERAIAALKQVAAKPLNASQQEMAARVKTFLTQAAAARGQDLSTALQLARRADLLGQELLKSVR